MPPVYDTLAGEYVVGMLQSVFAPTGVLVPNRSESPQRLNGQRHDDEMST